MGLPTASEPVRPENPDPGGAGVAPDPEFPGGAHDPIGDVDGDEMVPRVPNLHPEPSAKQIAEHELTGHVVYRSWCRHRMRIPHERMESCRESASIMASLVVTEDVLPILCVSSVGTVQPDAWERQLLTGRERQITRVHF